MFEDLNVNQKRVLYSDNKRILCLAGAGTGKTHTLISKVLYLTKEKNVLPSSILCLTFTNAAAAEMKSRYSIHSTTLSEPYFGTFHSFCYQLICNDISIREYLHYSEIPDVASDSLENDLKTKAQLISGVKLPKKALSLGYIPTLKEKFSFDIYHKTLDKLLREQNLITFDKMCYSICLLFNSNSELVQRYKEQYEYVIVDEFQDTDRLQWLFVQSFLPSSHVLAVGDIRQNLYSFRGTSNQFIKDLSVDSSWETINLTYNYRSTIEICNFVNEFTKNYRDGLPNLQLKSDRRGPTVRHLTLSGFQSLLISHEIQKEPDVAILCRTNQEVSNLCDTLSSLQLEYRTKKSQTLQNVFIYAFDSKLYMSYLLSLLKEDERTALLKEQIIDSTTDILPYLEQRFPEVSEQVNKIRRLPNYYELYDQYHQRTLNLDTLSQNYDCCDNFNESQSIYIGTIHSVKGLEFNSVYVYGVNSKYFPIKANEDNMNIYYVACTRAKNILTIVSD